MDARSIKSREATLFRADGVVAHKPRFKTHSEARIVGDHRVRSLKEASRHFIDVASTPPHEEGSQSLNSRLNLPALRPDPLIHLLREQIQRHCTYVQYQVVIFPERELISQRFPRFLTKLDDL